MTRDSELLVEKPDSFNTILISIFSKANIKKYFVVFLIYIILHNDVFINKILSNVGGSVMNDTITSKGTVILGVLMVLAYILLDIVVSNDII